MVVEPKKLVYSGLAVCCVSFMINKCYAGQMYFSMERPKIHYFDRDSFSNATIKSRLLNRRDPIHYVTVNFTSNKVLDNKYTASVYFYELLSNVYKRSFVEIHYKFCDILEKDEIIGGSIREGYYRVPEKERVMSVLKCPVPPGFYSFVNLRFHFSALVDTFPFQQGRVYLNFTLGEKLLACLSVDFQLKHLPKYK